MKKFFNRRMDELNVGQTLVYSLVVTAVCYSPFLMFSFFSWLKEKIEDRRYYSKKAK